MSLENRKNALKVLLLQQAHTKALYFLTIQLAWFKA